MMAGKINFVDSNYVIKIGDNNKRKLKINNLSISDKMDAM
jgi:hypothetical protein